MENQDDCENGPPLLLSSLQLFIPPLRLISASMWQVIQRGDVHDYGILEEFIATVTEIVPEILTPDQKIQLFLGLRARVVLDLCRAEQIVDLETIQMHLEKIRTLISSWTTQTCFADMELPESNFVDQVESLLKDLEERERFFQDVFPMDFGPTYDRALQMLMLEFLSRLERLIPVPDFQQTASLLDAVPSALEECVQSVPDPQQLKTVLQYHTTLGQYDSMEQIQTSSSSYGDCIFSSLSLPPPVRVMIDTEQLALETHSETMHGCVTVEVEGETVTLLNYITIEQPSELDDGQSFAKIEVKGDDNMDEELAETVIDEENTVHVGLEEEGTSNQDLTDALKPASFQPLKQSKRLQLKKKALKIRKAMKNDPSTSPPKKRARKTFPNCKKCPVCNKTFLRATAMRRHQEIHSQNRELKYQCPYCDKRFRDQYDMNRHKLRIHEKEGEDESTCENEDPQPSTSTSPTSDRKKSQDRQLESKNCPVCGKYFGIRNDLTRHMKSHSEERPFQCIYCQKKFKYAHALKRHFKETCKSVGLNPLDCISSVGNGESIISGELQDSTNAKGLLETKACPICNRNLPCNADMAKHVRSHTEARPFHCVGCDKSFKYKDTLKKHQIIHGHEGIREEPVKSMEQILAEVDQQYNSDRRTIELGALGQATKKELKTCTVCWRTFDQLKNLNKHMLCHSDERPYHCVHCKKRFKRLYGLKRHQIYVICKQSVTRASQKTSKQDAGEGSSGGTGKEANSNDHYQVPPLKIPVWCSNCGKHFDYLCDLKEHQETVCKIEEKDIIKCDDCGKEFKSLSLLKVHQRIHNPFYCAECGKILQSEAALERHKLMHKPIRCTMCDKTFTLLRRLREHYLIQHQFVGPYPCSHCEKAFTQLSYLVHHERIHTGEFPYECNMCLERFRSSNCLTVHQRKHTGEKPFLCWQCGKCYRSASELTVHMGTHSEEKPFACTQCDMAYRTKLQLTTHVEQVHIGVRYPCNHCGKQFMKEVSLKRHELIHTGERPHQCTECGKTFLTANELRLHTRYHTGERPYKCDECGKAFIQSGYLKSHMRIHTGEKPFKCEICNKGFRMSYHMKKHRRTHTGKQKTFVCEDCGLAFTHRKSLSEHQLTHSVKIELTPSIIVGIALP